MPPPALDKSLLDGLPVFAGLSATAIEDVLDKSGSIRYPRGEAVFEQGQSAGFFYLLLHGRLRVTQITPEGQQIIVRMVNPGDLFGMAKALQRRDYPGTATAVTDSVVLRWPMEVWQGLIDRHPAFAVNVMQVIASRLQDAHTRIREMSTEAVERRVGHAVLRLVNQSGRKEEGGIRIDFPISRQEIAEMAGTTLHTVSRILSAWESAGIVDGGRQKLLVRDPHRLLLLADGHIEGLLR